MNVYDFDNTIYDGESAFDFFISYLKVRPSLILKLPKVIIAFGKYKLGKITTDKMMTEYAPLIREVFCDYDKWDEFVKSFWDSHEKNIKKFYLESRQDDDVILTASPQITINEIAKRLGIKNVVCSVIDNETGEVTRLCMRERKIDAFYEMFGKEAKIDSFYTDSIENDKFFADLADNVYLVSGNEIKKIK